MLPQSLWQLKNLILILNDIILHHCVTDCWHPSCTCRAGDRAFLGLGRDCRRSGHEVKLVLPQCLAEGLVQRLV